MRRLHICLIAVLSLALRTPGVAQVAKPSAVGLWLGTLNVGATKLRLQFHLDPATGTCSIDSLDQGAQGIVCAELKNTDSKVSFTVPVIHSNFHGTLSADGKTLEGVWTQGTDLPITLTRQTQPTAVATPKLDPALPPVDPDQLKAVLDKDLATQIQSGFLSPAQHGGVVIGILHAGKRSIFTYGEGHAEDLYEIGSISKTFTGLILAQMVTQHLVTLDTSVRDLLPAGTVTKPATGRELTLLDLSSQHSGLPRMPSNFAPADPTNPYADYDAKRLYAFMKQQGVAIAPDAPFVYSNLGVGLLGQALSNRAAKPYPQLLYDQVTGPLGMTETAITLTPVLKSRFAQGYDADHHPAHAWDLDALAGAGGIRSTANDMLTYLEAQLHPDQLPPAAASTPEGKTLATSIAASHILHGEVGPGMHIALNWFHNDNGIGFWHNGGTGGYSSFARFDPDRDLAFVILCNTAPNGFADTLASHITQRLLGKPATSMDDH